MIDLTPRQIVAELDKYIVGQNSAKKMCGGGIKKPLSPSAIGRTYSG